MSSRLVRQEDFDVWVTLRHALWPDCESDALAAEARDLLQSSAEVCFVVTEYDSEKIVGFLEGAVHEGPHGPYGHVEGWYIAPEYRRRGFGKELLGQFEQWSLHRAIFLLTSDTTHDYPISPTAHVACGYRQIHEFKIFLKKLDRS